MHPIVENVFKGEDPKSIFEVGCGTGALFKPYIDEQGERIVGGIDIDPRNIEAAVKIYPKYADNFVLHDINREPWPVESKSYDIVFSIGTLIMLPDPFPAMREMIRIAKKAIIVAEYHDPLKDEYGDSPTPYIPGQLYSVRFTRNYDKLFNIFGMKPTIEQVYDKWVIKWQVKNDK